MRLHTTTTTTYEWATPKSYICVDQTDGTKKNISLIWKSGSQIQTKKKHFNAINKKIYAQSIHKAIVMKHTNLN